MSLNFRHFKVMSTILLFPLTVIPARYDYLWFENFELTKNAFLNEQELVKNLRIIRNDLSKRMRELNATIRYISHKDYCADKNEEIVHNLIYRVNSDSMTIVIFFRFQKTILLKTWYSKYRSLKQKIIHFFHYDKIYNTNIMNIMDAAQRGIIMLQETYNQDIKQYSAGHLRLKNVIEDDSRNIDFLQPDDLASMSSMAFHYFHWYDTSLKYLRAAIDMFYSLSQEKRYESPNTLEKSLSVMRKQYPVYHNAVLHKKTNPIGTDWKVYAYIVNTETLEAQSNDTTEWTEFDSVLNVIQADRKQHRIPLEGQLRESLIQNVCNGKIKTPAHWYGCFKDGIPCPCKCHFVHHFASFLRIGPFKLEVKLDHPFRTVFHDFFTEKEMDWILDYSKPRLSESRQRASFQGADLQNNRQKKATVTKAVTTWFNDIEYNEPQTYIKTSSQGEPLAYEHPPLTDPYSFKVEHETMHRISRKVELATNFNVTTRHGASKYQTTNYGLSGMVVSHMDPWGYEKGAELVEDRQQLSITGDYIGTFMGWLQDTQAGGNTAFIDNHFEGTVEPTKGSAAFWVNLLSCHTMDRRSTHAGCPVLKGSKWILNKWINSWAQWKKWPCYLEPDITIRPFKGMSS